MEAIAARSLAVRPLMPTDLDRVVALDHEIEGRSRRAYLAHRIAAVRDQPEQHVQLCADDHDGFAGFILARVLSGEFGRSEPALRLEAIGVRADAKGAGIGAKLFAGLADWARRHRIGEVRTQAAWRHHAMLRWLDEMGFELAQASVVDRPVAQPSSDEGEIPLPDDEREIDYGRQASNDFQRARRDRADVRAMLPGDLDDVVRIDRERSGRDRAAYIAGRLDETLADSAINVSLVARVDGIVAGFVTARVDLGDFGRIEPVAVIDTIGVDPALAHRGTGGAMLSQLLLNLSALRVERVETVVAPKDYGLVAFLHANGFAPSQRLAFVCRTGKA
jgi:GNAT superfamily N-acetyltransferase